MMGEKFKNGKYIDSQAKIFMNYENKLYEFNAIELFLWDINPKHKYEVPGIYITDGTGIEEYCVIWAERNFWLPIIFSEDAGACVYEFGMANLREDICKEDLSDKEYNNYYKLADFVENFIPEDQWFEKE